MFSGLRGLVLAGAFAAVLTTAADARAANAAAQSGLPDDVVAKIIELGKNNVRLKCLAFSSNGWVILYDDNKFFAKNIPDDTFNALQRLQDKGRLIKWVAFTPDDGWCVLSDAAAVLAKGIPDEAFARMQKMADNGDDFRSVTFTAKGGWVVFANDNDLFSAGLPKEASDRIKKVTANGDKVKSFAMAPGGAWAILYGVDGFESRGLSDDLFTKLKKFKASGKVTFNCVSLPTDNSWAIFAE